MHIGFSHIMNSIYWADASGFARRKHTNYDWVRREITTKNALVLRNYLGTQFIGGTIGFSGNHDHLPLATDCYRRLKGIKEGQYLGSFPEIIPDSQEYQTLKLMMKEKIAIAALGSDAGYYILCGDEYGDLVPKEIFTLPNGQPIYNLPISSPDQSHWEGKFDLTKFIFNINKLLDKMSAPDQHYWVEFVYLDETPNIFVAIRHNGLPFEEKIDVATIDMQTDEIVNLTEQQMQMILDISSSRIKKAIRLTDASHYGQILDILRQQGERMVQLQRTIDILVQQTTYLIEQAQKVNRQLTALPKTFAQSFTSLSFFANIPKNITDNMLPPAPDEDGRGTMAVASVESRECFGVRDNRNTY